MKKSNPNRVNFLVGVLYRNFGTPLTGCAERFFKTFFDSNVERNTHIPKYVAKQHQYLNRNIRLLVKLRFLTKHVPPDQFSTSLLLQMFTIVLTNLRTLLGRRMDENRESRGSMRESIRLSNQSVYYAPVKFFCPPTPRAAPGSEEKCK